MRSTSWRAIATTPPSTRTRFRARQFRVMLRYGPSTLRRACAILANRFRARRRFLSDFVRSKHVRCAGVPEEVRGARLHDAREFHVALHLRRQVLRAHRLAEVGDEQGDIRAAIA